MQNNINTIIANALQVDKNIDKNIMDIISQIKKAINSNKEAIIQVNKIDKKNNNGFIMDFNIIDNIFSIIEKENIKYGNVTLQQKDDELMYGKQLFDVGNVVVINDGNPYVIIEMALRNLLALNTTIFSNNGFMYGTNQFLIQIMQTVLEQFKVSQNFIQLYTSDNYSDVLKNFANIDLVVCIGNHELQNTILNKSKNKTIVSGYENFDLYVEDKTNMDFLNKIVNSGVNIQIFINNNCTIKHPDAIMVDDIDEAIAQINYNGNRYSSAIFTKNSNNASKFIKEVKSKIVTINTSPTIERIIDIKQSDLMIEKTIIYPIDYKITDSLKFDKNSNIC